MLTKRLQPIFFGWLAIGLLLLIGTESDDSASLAAFGFLGLIHSAVGFLKLGGPRFTAGGVFLLSTGLFVFFPALYVATNGPSFAGEAAAEAAVYSYFIQICIAAFWWGNDPVAPQPALVDQPRTSSFAFFMGLLLTIAGIGLDVAFGLDSTTLGGAATFVGVTMLGVAALSGSRLTVSRLLVTVVAAGLYVLTMFDGGGRLVLGSLAIAIILTLNMARPRLWHKAASIVVLPIGLLLLASNRSNAVLTSRGGIETGLESVVWPFERFAQLLEQSLSGSLPYAWGETLIAPVVFFVPRALWPDKPLGLGAELAAKFRPELVGVGHSEAALIHGEAVWNFGVLGLMLLVPIVGIGIRYVDLLLLRSRERTLETRRSVLLRTTSVLITAGILDFVWVGTFGVAARTGQRLLILLVVFIVFVGFTKSRAARPVSGSTPHANGRVGSDQ